MFVYAYYASQTKILILLSYNHFFAERRAIMGLAYCNMGDKDYKTENSETESKCLQVQKLCTPKLLEIDSAFKLFSLLWRFNGDAIRNGVCLCDTVQRCMTSINTDHCVVSLLDAITLLKHKLYL